MLKQYDTARANMYLFKKMIENELPSFLKQYEPKLYNVLGINSNIVYDVMNTLYNEYID